MVRCDATELLFLVTQQFTNSYIMFVFIIHL